MLTTKNKTKLKSSISNLLSSNSQTSIISIDGWTSSGKSTVIAPYVSKVTGWEILDSDEKFLVKEKGYFKFDVPNIKEVLSTETNLIIDSILTQEILKIGKINSSIKIYVKKIRKDGSWIHEHIVSELSTLEKLVTHYHSPLDVQLIKYHRKYQPHINSDIIFEFYDPFNDDETIIPEMFTD